MKKLTGISASPGVAIGIVCVYQASDSSKIEHYNISQKQLKNELYRLDEALLKAEKEIKQLKEASGNLFGDQGHDIISAHLSILKDKGLQNRIKEDISVNLVNAEHAIQDVFESYIKKLTGISSDKVHFEEITHDIADVKDRLLDSFFKKSSGKFECPVGEKSPVIIAANRLTPSMVIKIPKDNVLAFVTKEGGLTAHASILARTLGIPVVFGIDIEKELNGRCHCIVDGSLGKVIVNPAEKILKHYRQMQEKYHKRKKLCKLNLSQPTRTAQGKRISLKVNISTLGELELLKTAASVKESDEHTVHYDGVGLLRTEFIFMNKNEPPDEELQLEIYKKISRAANERPVTVRIMDLSGDKVPKFINIPPGINTDMNLRGASAVLTYRDIYLTQARALLRAASESNIKILFPMVSDMDDYYIFKNLIDEAVAQLKKEGKNYAEPELGIMFETPSASLLADQLFPETDFANIGTNDLLQYLVASSREHKISSHTYNLLHPSVVKMLKMITQAADKNGKAVCLCGEIGSFELYYPVLLDAGVNSFSVPAAKYEDIKCEIQNLQERDYKGKYKEYINKKFRREQIKFFEG